MRAVPHARKGKTKSAHERLPRSVPRFTLSLCYRLRRCRVTAFTAPSHKDPHPCADAVVIAFLVDPIPSDGVAARLSVVVSPPQAR